MKTPRSQLTRIGVRGIWATILLAFILGLIASAVPTLLLEEGVFVTFVIAASALSCTFWSGILVVGLVQPRDVSAHGLQCLICGYPATDRTGDACPECRSTSIGIPLILFRRGDRIARVILQLLLAVLIALLLLTLLT